MIEIALCDDEEYTLEELKTKVSSDMDSRGLPYRLFPYTSGERFVAENRDFHLIFMDIRLARMNGIEIAQQLRRQGRSSQIVFITAYKEYVFQAFDVDAVHYLVKPVDDRQLSLAIHKALKHLQQGPGQRISVSSNGAVRIIAVKEILYCESMDHKITLHTTAGNVEYTGTLDRLQTQLGQGFFRCHRSFLINLAFVKAIEGDLAILTNEERIPISRRKLQGFTQSLLSFFGGQVTL